MSKAQSDAAAFRLWATNLGFPPEKIPKDEALTSVFKSPQRDFFYTLMQRVKPRQEVEALRQHILLQVVEKLGNQTVPTSSRTYLPQQLQIYLKKKDLEVKKAECEARLDEYRKEYEASAATLKTRNIKVINAKHKNEVLQAKVSVLQLKSESLAEDVRKEEEIKSQLVKYMPVKLTSENASEIAADEAVQQALIALDSFYNTNSDGSNPVAAQAVKDDLWSKLRKIFANVPNFLLFNAIMRLKEQQLQSIMELNKPKSEVSSLGTLTTKQPMSPFEKEFTKAKIDLLAVFVRYNEARKECNEIEATFSNRYIHFVDEFQKKVREYNPNEDNEDRIDDVISDYLLYRNLRTFLKHENNYIRTQIDKYHAEIQQRAKQLEIHDVLFGTVQQIYNDINARINKIQYDMLQLGQIKQKILYSRNLLKHKVNDVQAQMKTDELVPSNVNKGTAAGIDILINSVDSFESDTDNVLCSTKLDLEASTISVASASSVSMMNRSFAYGNGNLTTNMVPQHLLELSTFAEIPCEKLGTLNKVCEFYLSPNPLVIESRELTSTLQLAPGTLLSQHGVLQEMRNRIAWADSIASHLSDLKLNLPLTAVDANAYKERSKLQHERLIDLFDKINAVGINTKHMLEKASKVYNFILENTLAQFVPPTKLVNGQAYPVFEAEFRMYYRVATGRNPTE